MVLLDPAWTEATARERAFSLPSVEDPESCTRCISCTTLAPWQQTSRSRPLTRDVTSARCLMRLSTTACMSRYAAITILLPTLSRPSGTSAPNRRSRPTAGLTRRPGNRAGRRECSQHSRRPLITAPRARIGDLVETLLTVDAARIFAGRPESARAARVWVVSHLPSGSPAADDVRAYGVRPRDPCPSLLTVGPARRLGHRASENRQRPSPCRRHRRRRRSRAD